MSQREVHLEPRISFEMKAGLALLALFFCAFVAAAGYRIWYVLEPSPVTMAASETKVVPTRVSTALVAPVIVPPAGESESSGETSPYADALQPFPSVVDAQFAPVQPAMTSVQFEFRGESPAVEVHIEEPTPDSTSSNSDAQTRQNSPQPTSAPAPPVIRQHRQYRTQSDETLYEIARLELGDVMRWGEIYKLNQDVLRESFPHVPVGMVIRLPSR